MGYFARGPADAAFPHFELPLLARRGQSLLAWRRISSPHAAKRAHLIYYADAAAATQ